MEEIRKVFGIDLGTTYSCIAHVDEHGVPTVLKNSEGTNTTPSVVQIESETSIVVGAAAKDTAIVEPERVVSFVKRSMGQPNSSFNIEGNTYSAEEISSFILRKVVQDAEMALGSEIKDVVITCPAYFGMSEREATKKAGVIAGLNVLSIIDEPVAAAITYGCTQDAEEKVVLVYDLGGGTFDVTMIKVTDGKIDVICTGGDHFLGGKNWDDAIVTYVAEQFEAEMGVDADELLDDPETQQDLQSKAEKAKIQLTQKELAKISINYEGKKMTVELTKETFEEITSDLVHTRAMSKTQEMLTEAAEKGITKFDEILLVGGSARMPMIVKSIRDQFGVEPKIFDPDESVAKGAAIYGAMLKYHVAVEESKDKGEPEPGPFTLGGRRTHIEVNPVTSKSFGVKAFTSNNREQLVNLITKNTNVPANVTQTFGTHAPNQEVVEIVIMETTYKDDVVELDMGVEIGSVVLELPPGLPANSPIDITFILTKEGRLEMRAVEQKEFRDCKSDINITNGITDEELEAAQSRGMQISD